MKKGPSGSPRPPAARARACANWRYPADACVFTYVGAHGVVNGLDMLLDAAEAAPVEAGGAPIHVVLAGAGSAYAQLTQRLAARPIANLHLLGPVPKERARDLLAAADVGLHLLRPGSGVRERPSHEGARIPRLPPAVHHDRAGPAEARSPRRPSGDLATDAASLTAAMHRWAGRSEDERRAAGEAAFAWGEAQYEPSASVDRLETALRDTITRT